MHFLDQGIPKNVAFNFKNRSTGAYRGQLPVAEAAAAFAKKNCIDDRCINYKQVDSDNSVTDHSNSNMTPTLFRKGTVLVDGNASRQLGFR